MGYPFPLTNYGPFHSSSTLASYTFLSVGATGWVYKINNRLVVKYPRDAGGEGLRREIEVLEVLEGHEPCPDVVQSFLHVENGIFLEYLSNGTLEQRLRTHQLRTKDGILIISKLEPASLIERWAMELCNAAAWLESLGLVHGDIRPPNLLLDSEDHLKLADFDCAMEIGTPYGGAAPPWARLLGPEAGPGSGTFGLCGPRTEQFAIGSILYLMARGHEPFELETEDGPQLVTWLQHMRFPRLGEGRLDRIIGRCWKGQFPQLVDLRTETEDLPSAKELPRAKDLGVAYRFDVREECQRLVQDGLLS